MRATAAALFAIVGALACGRPMVSPRGPGSAAGVTAGSIRITLVQLNDVYEITPVAGGRWGGPARVATLKRQLAAGNANTFLVLAGDMLSPSALGTARFDGQRLDGRQMVEVLNALGLDFATFGNHEFDLNARAFQDRLRESKFAWLSANVTTPDGAALPGVLPHRILRIGQGRDTVRVALFGVTMDRDPSAYAAIRPPVAAALERVRLLRDSADIIIALTHQPLAQDVALAEASTDIDLIAGGHEHENVMVRRGDELTPIAKADANARTVWVHDIAWDVRARHAEIRSRLVPITDSLPDDPATRAVAEQWVQRAYSGFRQAGFEPDSVVAESHVALDGLESSVLRDTTTLTRIVARAMLAESGAQAVVYNAGSIRLDDVLPPGRITQYDVIRILPFGGPVVDVDIRGSLLRRVLEQGVRNRGTGGFLQRANIEPAAGGGWLIAGAPLEDGTRYHIAMGDFLLSGREQGMDWLTRQNPELIVRRDGRDIRLALIDELRRQFPR